MADEEKKPDEKKIIIDGLKIDVCSLLNRSVCCIRQPVQSFSLMPVE